MDWFAAFQDFLVIVYGPVITFVVAGMLVAACVVAVIEIFTF